MIFARAALGKNIKSVVARKNTFGIHAPGRVIIKFLPDFSRL